ncbi:hypothetical protein METBISCDRAFT_25673 [Metschnikowia bicuspidata]|uniref:F-box domain-containing protein n=1 Tax=Metschnikowia bicuspidata TaxID=27322 RepID=A0A4P9ZH30_9ASCO|nr:hypothetical protein METBISCDRAFT_25673 [Metschnikowia bicuspidata]
MALETTHPPHINDLPAEVLLNVFCRLSPVDLRDVLLVCRRWNSVVLDKAAWSRAFDNRFRTGDVFASVTGSRLWVREYFGRVALLRVWAKAKSVARLYMLINGEYGLMDRVSTDFLHDRLLKFSHAHGTVSLCTLTLGKNQMYIPENHQFASTLAFDVNWNYLCVGTTHGEVYLKNLIIAVSSDFNRLSLTRLAAGSEPVVGLKINPQCDRHREWPDVVLVTQSGNVQFVTLGGKRVAQLHLHLSPFLVDTDFATSVVVVTDTNVFVIDFASKLVVHSFPHGWVLDAAPAACSVDLFGLDVVLGHETEFKVFHILGDAHTVAEGRLSLGTTILDGTLQDSDRPRDKEVAGGDGRLYALTLSDGSVGVFELRQARSPIAFKTWIMPFADDRTPQNIHVYTKVALNSSVIAIGALADWIHFYDAHSGHYLREGAKVSRKLTRNGMVPILYIRFAPDSASGVVVSGNVVQYFRYGDEALELRRRNAPQALDMSNKRAIKEHIKTQLEEYDELEQSRLDAEIRVDKFNGTAFDSEQEELRVALALSASTMDAQDEELERALALLREEVELSEQVEDWTGEWGSGVSEPSLQMGSSRTLKHAETEDEILQRVLRLSMLD